MKKLLIAIVIIEVILIVCIFVVDLYISTYSDRPTTILQKEYSPNGEQCLVVRKSNPSLIHNSDYFDIYMYQAVSPPSPTLRVMVSSDDNDYQIEWLADGAKLTFFGDDKPDRVYILPFD